MNPTTARQATTAVKRAIRAAGIDVSTIEVRSRNASTLMASPASSWVFNTAENVVEALRQAPGVTKVEVYDDHFVSVQF